MTSLPKVALAPLRREGLKPAPSFPLDRAARVILIVTGTLLTAAIIYACARLTPAWVATTGVALTLFFALKLATLDGIWRSAATARLFGYLTLWPGMRAETFLCRGARVPSPGYGELGFAGGKVLLGLMVTGLAIERAAIWPDSVLGAVGVAGLVFTIHFGLFHLVSWGWRRAGVDAPVVMVAPIAACSLADFWGARWNTAFTALTRRFLLRPCARSLGARATGWLIFLVSGLVHDLAISLPARGGWGRPTLYFLIEAAGVTLEKSRLGRRLGLGRGVRGWLWTMLIVAAPLPLLFHPPLLERVVAPLFRFLKEVL